MERSSETEREKVYGIRHKTVCFTGHRTIPQKDLERLVGELDRAISEAIDDGYSVFMAGGALGFDTVAAFRVLAAREKRDDIRLVLVLPCRNQTEKWTNLQSIREYQMLKDNANAVMYIQDFYDEGCMLKRNRFMVDKSSRLIGYVTRARGGSAYTANYAAKCGLEYINLADRL